jgi:hypothetical protein
MLKLDNIIGTGEEVDDNANENAGRVMITMRTVMTILTIVVKITKLYTMLVTRIFPT